MMKNTMENRLMENFVVFIKKNSINFIAKNVTLQTQPHKRKHSYHQNRMNF